MKYAQDIGNRSYDSTGLNQVNHEERMNALEIGEPGLPDVYAFTSDFVFVLRWTARHEGRRPNEALSFPSEGPKI